MSQAAQANLAGILGVRHVLDTGICLGLPSMVGRSKKTIFSYIKDRISKRINSWRGRALSKAGKEIMIKSVLQIIPAYVMSMFILPSSFIDDIEKMINVFWCGCGNGNSKCIHWLAWERLVCPKDKEALDFRNFEAFNMAMVAKQAWNILQNLDTLVARLIKTRWRIGGGDKIHVMSDPWLRGNGERWIPSPQLEGMYNLFVRDLMIDNYKAWNVNKIRMLFPVQVAERIIATPLIGSVYVDKMIWEDERNGYYSIKSGYKLAMKCIFRNDKYHVEEDDVHAFFTCVSAQSSWQAAGLSSVLGSAAC
ncbi:ribonuclease H, partial [Trifolium pratense]